MATPIEKLAEHACFGGRQGFYRHASTACEGPMRFGVFVPPQAASRRVPVVFYLAGLTCTEETFAIKAGAQRYAAELGLMLVMPDTSPREPALPGDRDDWDFGQGASFYVDATEEPWRRHYRMATYIAAELPSLIDASFPADPSRRGIFGHSMGGHGAIVAALRNPQVFASCSALAPVASASRCPWGRKAYAAYLGADVSRWAAYDACDLIESRRDGRKLKVDVGTDDKFLVEQLKPELLEAACARAGQPLDLARRPGYDHSYWFVQSHVGEHLAHHARELG